MNCNRCESPLKPGRHKCSCGAWTWSETSVNTLVDETVLFEHVKSAEDTRLKTGLLDENLGGGIVTTSVVLIGGLPGAGKSTLLLQLANIFCRRELLCMYIAAEEGLPAIKARGDRLGIKPKGFLRLVPAIGGVSDVGLLLAQHQPKAIILDSINGLVGHDSAQEVAVLGILKKYAVGLGAPIFVISQVNKEADFSGLMAKQHEVDCLLTMQPHAELRTDNGEAYRCVETIKNRHGRAFITTWFEMTGRGLEPTDDPELEDGSESEDSEDE